MKESLTICAALAILLLCGGCATFRDLFDEDPAVTQQKREKARQRREARERSEEENADPFSFFSSKKREKDSLLLSSSLTPEEKAELEKSEAASKRIEYDEVKAIRRENREREKKASDQVFGSGLNDLLNP